VLLNSALLHIKQNSTCTCEIIIQCNITWFVSHFNDKPVQNTWKANSSCR